MTLMKFADRLGNSSALLVLVLMLAIVTACSTIVPEPIAATGPSYDGNDLNSGVVAAHSDGFVVTEGFLHRYELLVGKFGNRFVPELETKDGIQIKDIGVILIDREHMVKFIQMNTWNKSENKIAP